MLLGGDANHEGGDVDHLFADSDVLLSNKDASVVNRVGDFALHDEGLEATFHKLGNSKTENVIEFAL